MSLPQAFLNNIQLLLGDESPAFLASLREEAPVSIRINPAKTALPAHLERVPWSNTGFYLNERPQFTLDPLFHAGHYYVQEASSMFLEQAIKTVFTENSPKVILDLCAAPGGKSTLLSSLCLKIRCSFRTR